MPEPIPIPEPRRVELLQAFVWTCDDCGRDNFVRGVTVAPEEIDPDDLPADSPGEAEAIREWVDAGGEGYWVRAPRKVRCVHCGAGFATDEPEGGSV